MTEERKEQDAFHEAERTLRDELTRALTTTRLERAGMSAEDAQHAQRIGRLLPHAIESCQAQGDALAESLSPALEKAFSLSARRNRGPLVEALAGLVGPAVRKSLYEHLHGFAMGLNDFLLRYFTWRGWKWRFEALRTGQAYRDIVHRHRTVHPVKQVFLIHRETGLLLQQIQSGTFEPHDGDMVSGMLTAVQDFVHDSFSVRKSDRLETIRVGELTVWIEQSPHAVLAGIMQGELPPDLRASFRQVLSRIHARFDDELVRFRGDTSVFERTRPELERCLRLEAHDASRRIMLLTWIVLLAPLLAAGHAAYRHVQVNAMWEAYLGELKATPGVIVIEFGRHDGRRFVRGLRDPMAENPLITLRRAGLSPGDIDSEWEPYRSMHPELALARARTVLEPPPTVSLRLQDGVLTADGAAPDEWITRARILAKSLDAVSEFRADGLASQSREEDRRWALYTAALSSSPGIVVAEQGVQNGRRRVSGLRDPLAADPVAMLTEYGFDPAEVTSQWEPYFAADPALALSRARKVLSPPPTVELSLDADGVLAARGVAPHQWIVDAKILAKGLSGVSFFAVEKLEDRDMTELGRLKEQIESNVFYLLLGKPDLLPGQEKQLAAMTELIREFNRVARRTGYEYAVELRGHTDSSRDEDTNVAVSATVARRFLESLKWQNLDMGVFRTRGLGSVMPAPRPNQRTPPSHDAVLSVKIVQLGD